ncbi:UPF0262 family protein [Parvularcula sp. ZS-1/3]|uniref:UPF0262 protein HK107_09920 n=1 Tax=Parvularcula mediterranea TaxID=2732508 RepID=A0A7Y3RM53_9PROT|nr:UPF0262 family protein [Parvularcula mediterranea]NNU16637.1 UPF0262 family protein [Parvularcula mediterranea]
MDNKRLGSVELDEKSLGSAKGDIDHERKVAMHDLLQENSFAPAGATVDGPYQLKLSEQNGRLIFDIRDEQGGELVAHHLSLAPLRKLIKDYFLLCENYYDAIRAAQPEKLETIDMARRAVHNEGTEILLDRLDGKIETDFETARRVFTLICSLAMRMGRGTA